MTVRLLCAYERYPVNAIVSLDAGTEAGLIAAKQASADTTGGTPFMPISGPVQSRTGMFSVEAARARTILLPEGQALTAVGAAGTVGTVTRLDAAGVPIGTPWAVGVGAMPQIGPYSGVQKVLITCTAGSIDATVGDAVLNSFLDKTMLRLSRSIAAAERANRMKDSPWGPAPTWAQNTVYTPGQVVRGLGADAANLYMLVGSTTVVGDATQATARTATSAASGNGPSGTGIQGTAGASNVAFATVTRVGATATFTLTGGKAHGMGIGYQFNASGITPSGFNGTWNVASVASPSAFTAVLSADPGGDATVPGAYIQYNTIVDGTCVWTYVGKATSTGTMPLYSTVTPAGPADVMDGFTAVIAAANYTALGLVPTTTSAANPKFRVSGVLPAAWGTFQGSPGGPVSAITRPVYYTRPVVEIETNSDTWIAIRPQASMTQYLQLLAIEINGRWISESPWVSRAASGSNALLLNLAPFGKGKKNIRLQYRGANVTNGANWAYEVATPADSFAYPPSYPNSLRLAIETDSIGAMVGIVGGLNPMDMLEGMYQAQLGVTDVYNGGVGGTGIISTSGGALTNYLQRIPDIVAFNPDIFIMTGNVNDDTGNSSPSPANQALYLQYFQALRAALPNVPIFITPRNRLRNDVRANALATENDLLIAFNTWNDPYSCFIPVLTGPTDMETSTPGKFYTNVSPYTDTHPWPLFHHHRAAFEIAAIKNFVASKA